MLFQMNVRPSEDGYCGDGWNARICDWERHINTTQTEDAQNLTQKK